MMRGYVLAATLRVAAFAAACGVALASLITETPLALVMGSQSLRIVENPGGESRPKGDTDSGARDDPRAGIRLTDDQIEMAGIQLAAVQDGTLAHRIAVPGTIVPHADRIARVSVRLSATVMELRKKLGDAVAKGEVIAVLESREVANAKSEYLAARLNNDLQRNLYERDKTLIAEQIVLRSQRRGAGQGESGDFAAEAACARSDGHGNSSAHIGTCRRTQGGPRRGRRKGRSGDRLFTVADLERVWVERAVGKIVFVSPILDKDTHSARVVAEIANPDGNWRPGSLVHAVVAIEERSAALALAVPVSSVQTVGKTRVVFVRTPEGFERRRVTLGDGDDRLFEVLSGLRRGETIAVSNTFALKAEFLKSLAEDWRRQDRAGSRFFGPPPLVRAAIHDRSGGVWRVGAHHPADRRGA